MPPTGVKIIALMVLYALDYLHSECRVIHTGETAIRLMALTATLTTRGLDLKPDNVMVKLRDLAVLAQDAENEFHHPSPRKYADDGRVVYSRHDNYRHLQRPFGVVAVTDFGLAVTGDEPRSGCIQAEVYRSPEAIFAGEYGYPADVWSLGCIVCMGPHCV